MEDQFLEQLKQLETQQDGKREELARVLRENEGLQRSVQRRREVVRKVTGKVAVAKRERWEMEERAHQLETRFREAQRRADALFEEVQGVELRLAVLEADRKRVRTEMEVARASQARKVRALEERLAETELGREVEVLGAQVVESEIALRRDGARLEGEARGLGEELAALVKGLERKREKMSGMAAEAGALARQRAAVVEETQGVKRLLGMCGELKRVKREVERKNAMLGRLQLRLESMRTVRRTKKVLKRKGKGKGKVKGRGKGEKVVVGRGSAGAPRRRRALKMAPTWDRGGEDEEDEEERMNRWTQWRLDSGNGVMDL